MKNGQKNYDRIMRSENYTRTKGKWDTRRRENHNEKNENYTRRNTKWA